MAEPLRPLTLGTAGHIDHGKTTLVKALTGRDTDRLKEEKERGISIELGFAELSLPSGRHLSVVDVPGHERFVKTMVAGATGIDLFLLVVAADDGVMPQTREHLRIIELLGIPAGVVALTKVDMVDRDLADLARADVEEFLESTRYAGTPIVMVSGVTSEGLPKLPVQYADFAAWQRSWLVGDELARQLAFWTERLRGAPDETALPVKGPRPPVQTFAGRAVSRALPAPLAHQVRALSRAHGATLFMTFAAALRALLARYTGQRELVLGAPIDNRSHTELAGLIGMFANTLALRGELRDDDSFASLLAREKANALAAYDHQHTPFELIVDALHLERTLSRPPLFQVLYQHQEATATRGAHVDAARDLTAQFDLTISTTEVDGSIAFGVVYNTDLFDQALIEQLAAHFQHLLELVTVAPDARLATLDVLSPAEHAQLAAWNATARDVEREPFVVGLIETQVDRTPDAIALTFERTSLTYAELDARANQLARRLLAVGAGPERPVAVSLLRSPDMIVALLAVLKAGAVYVPIDPTYPPARLRTIVDDAGCEIIVDRAWLDTEYGAITALPDVRPVVEVDGSSAAYIIFTSGSTGRPKGVVIDHAALRNQLLSPRSYGLSAADRCLFKTPFTFDMSLFQMLCPLVLGARLVVARPDGERDPDYLAQLIRDEDVTYAFFVPSMLSTFLDAARARPCRSLRRMTVGGEALPPALVEQTTATLAVDLYNLYGPTEATIHVSWHRCAAEYVRGSVPIGVPIANTRFYVLDRELQQVPLGVAGELYVAGIQLARGYAGRPDLTSERFVPDPFQPGERMYRTGDRARFLPDGAVEYLGRLDHQVKLRGLRIELGEIETVLRTHADVGDAAVLVREDSLVAYVVPRTSGTVIENDALQTTLRAALPEYMVPAVFMTLAALPLTPNGKLDRNALPTPEWTTAQTYIAPRNALETTIARIWAELLGIERVGVLDDFFSLGGHSLLAVRAIARLRRELSVELTIRALFEAPTVAGLAAVITRSHTDDGRALPPPLVAGPRGAHPPLSFAQERLWFLHQLEPDSRAYHIRYARRFDDLDVEALRRAFEVLVARHEILHTSFVAVDGLPYQRIHPPGPWALPIDDARGLDADRQRAHIAARRRVLDEPFDLAAAPPIRAELVRVGDTSYVLVVVMHHIVTDGGSFAILWGELWAAYDAFVAHRDAPVLPKLPVQYADFAAWQRSWLVGDELARQLAFWTERLRGAPDETALPVKGPRPPVQTFAGRAVSRALPAPLAHQVRALSRAHGATLFMTFAAALRALLARYTGQRELVLGAPIDNRSHTELAGLIGMFANTLALRGELRDDDSFASLLAREKANALAAYDHQHTPFELIVDALHLERTLSRPPLFQVLYQHQEVDARSTRGAYVETARDPTAQFDLTISTTEVDGSIAFGVVYNTDLFDHALVEQLAAHFQHLLELVTVAPDARLATLDVLSPAEYAQLAAWNATAHPVEGSQLVHERVAAQATRTPEAIAVEDAHQRLTYRELATRADRVAGWLATRGVSRGARITVALTRSADMVAALLGVLRAGAAYVPIDPEFPAQRRAFMRDDAGAMLELDDDTLAAALASDAEPPSVELAGEDVAYILYTSGSTGLPKGVRVPHRAVVNFLHSMQREPGISAHDALLAVTTLSFDIAGLEVFLPLVTGAKVVIADRDAVRDGDALARLLDTSHATIMQATPATWRMLLSAGWRPRPHLRVLCGGETLPADLAASLLTSNTDVWNLYGPTETTIWSTVARVEHDRPISIGRPIDNTTIYILDERRRPTPIGVAGELYISGHGVALGYHQRPELTGERFLADPFAPGARMYRTGDRARWTRDGTLEHLGRFDSQVKLRGFRIELGEIEAALRAQPDVADAAALVREDIPGDPRLVAYVVGSADVTALRARLADTLPTYMIPGAIVVLDALPLTPNGKLDRNALPKPERISVETYLPPRDDLEATLAEIWREALRVERVGVHDDFFALGGHSLLAIKLLASVERRLGAKIPLREFFVDSSLGGLATRVRQARAGDSSLERPTLYASATQRARLPAALRGVFKLNKLMTSDLFARHVWSAWIDGPLDHASLERAVAAMRVRHALLRTRFFEDNQREMLEVLDAADVERFALLDRIDLSSLPEAEQRPADTQFHRSASFRPLDVGHGEVMNVALSRWSATRHRLTVSLHNIASDAESLTIYLNELCALWRALAADPERDPATILPPAVLQYHHLADYLERVHDSDVGRAQRAFWARRLDGLQPLELPVDSPREAVDARREANAGVVAFRAGSLERTLPNEVLTAIERIAESRRATVMSTLVAAMAGYLSERTSQRDLTFITRLSHRYIPGLERALGFLVNPLVLRISTAGSPAFSELVERTHTVVTDAFDHGESDLFELAPYSAFRFCLVYTRAARETEAALTLPNGTIASRAPHPGASAGSQIGYDLLLWLGNLGDRVQLSLAYNQELFREATAAAFLEGYVRYVTAACPVQPR